MVYNPTFTRRQLKNKFSLLKKINYNPYLWWRMYESRTKPLNKRASLRDRILNGDFDFPHYWYQAEWVEHDINDLYEKHKDRVDVYIEKVPILTSRRKRLLEDFEREEKQKLETLIKDFSNNFLIDEEQTKKEMENCRGSLIDLYYIIEENYKKRITYGKKRGRPKKIA
jgi:hypothetical protein